MCRILPLIFFITLTNLCRSQNIDNSFVTIWDTRNQGLGDSTQVVIPLIGHYEIKWEEVKNPNNVGQIESCHDNTVISFPRSGVYRIFAFGDI